MHRDTGGIPDPPGPVAASESRAGGIHLPVARAVPRADVPVGWVSPPVPKAGPESVPGWLAMQLADSAFPAGSLAHSGGLEGAWQHGEIGRPDEFAAWLEASLRQSGTSQLPLVMCAHRDPDRRVEFDELTDAWLSNHVANRASRQQGRAFWMATGKAFGLADGGADSPFPGHLAPVYGFRCRDLGLSTEETARLFLFGQTRGWISAGVRLGIVGPLAAQGLQFGLAGLAEEIVARAPGLGPDDLAQVSPLLDLWQGAQDRLGARLFQS